MNSTKNEPLYIPALRARMGDWVYYVSFLTMKHIAERVSVIDDIHTSRSLKEQLQRALTKNAAKIADYLCQQEQRFFNAIVVGTYGGSPKWHEIAVKSKELALPEVSEGAFGFLVLQGTETLFAIDGQHRVVGIREAIQRKESLVDEEVTVIFVSGVTSGQRKKDPKGFERTRRLFSTLNRYAKPVQQRDIIALDEDDVIAIVTRQMVEDHQLLVEKVAMNKTMPLSPKDTRHFTTLVALYNCLDIVLRDRLKGWSDFKRERPSEDTVGEFAERANAFVDAMCRHFKPLAEVRDADVDDEVPANYRDTEGGHALFRPLGLVLTTQVIRDLVDERLSISAAVRRMAYVPMDLNGDPWANVLWDVGNERMITSKENKKIARLLLLHAVGGDITRLRYDTGRLKKELAGLLNTESARIKLKTYYA